MLVPDEAYYWQWSRYFSLGYHDHPPMIAWTIKLATLIFGQTERAVRLPAVCAITVASVYLMLAAARWFGARAALYVALLSQSILGFNAAGLLATPDGLLVAGWAGALYHVAAAYETDRPSQWLLGGAWFGFGILSKYTMVLFPPLAFAFGLFHPDYRKRLATFWPYAGIVLGLLMFAPVIIWNIDNGWSTFRHVVHKGGVDRQFALHLTYLGSFIGSQVALLSPLVFILLLMTWFLPLKKTVQGKHWVLIYFFITSFPVVAIFTVLSLYSRVEGNWAAPAYLGAVIIVAAVVGRLYEERSASRRYSIIKKLWPWSLATSLFITVLVFVHLYLPILPIPANLDRLSEETSEWEMMGKKVRELHQTMPYPDSTFIFGLKYQTASKLAFYAPGKPKTVSINRWSRPNTYDYWWDDNELIGKDAVGIGGNYPKHLARLRQVFESVEPMQKITIYRPDSPFTPTQADNKPVAEYVIYCARGFKGGLHWVPTNSGDVRIAK